MYQIDETPVFHEGGGTGLRELDRAVTPRVQLQHQRPRLNAQPTLSAGANYLFQARWFVPESSRIPARSTVNQGPE